MMRGPVWGGPQAAGKRHSQPFSQKRLPHPRGVYQGTKPKLAVDRQCLCEVLDGTLMLAKRRVGATKVAPAAALSSSVTHLTVDR